MNKIRITFKTSAFLLFLLFFGTFQEVLFLCSWHIIAYPSISWHPFVVQIVVKHGQNTHFTTHPKCRYAAIITVDFLQQTQISVCRKASHFPYNTVVKSNSSHLTLFHRLASSSFIRIDIYHSLQLVFCILESQMGICI